MADEIQRAALSIAKMVDEYTQRGWNEEGLEGFARIVERRLRRFIKTSPQTQRVQSSMEGK